MIQQINKQHTLLKNMSTPWEDFSMSRGCLYTISRLTATKTRILLEPHTTLSQTLKERNQDTSQFLWNKQWLIIGVFEKGASIAVFELWSCYSNFKSIFAHAQFLFTSLVFLQYIKHFTRKLQYVKGKPINPCRFSCSLLSQVKFQEEGKPMYLEKNP